MTEITAKQQEEQIALAAIHLIEECDGLLRELLELNAKYCGSLTIEVRQARILAARRKLAVVHDIYAEDAERCGEVDE